MDSKLGGYLDETDLPPSMSDDDEGGEWIEEEEEQQEQQHQKAESQQENNVIDGFHSEADVQSNCQQLHILKISS